jgi:hypothetical protein
MYWEKIGGVCKQEVDVGMVNEYKTAICHDKTIHTFCLVPLEWCSPRVSQE